MFHERPAKIDDIKLNANKRNIIYIIGHAVKKNGKNYIKLKDGYICINSFQEKGLDIKGKYLMNTHYTN